MIWLTWRQFRTSAMVVLAALGVLAAALAVTGGHLHDLSRTAGDTLLDQLAASRSSRTLYQVGIAVLYLLPAVVGAFWGAPLVTRELEAGTHRLVWSQSVTRTRWLAVKLAVTGLTAVAAAGLVSLAVTWWCAPVDRAIDHGGQADPFGAPRLSAAMFGARGLVPLGYTALAFALGVTVGLLVRRTVPAMAVTMAAVVGVQIAVPMAVVPHLLTPLQKNTPITMDTLALIREAGPRGPVLGLTTRLGQPGGWELSNRTVDDAGRPASRQALAKCRLPGPEAGGGAVESTLTACFAEFDRLGFHQRITYQPASRFWPLQWLAAGILLGLTTALVASDVWLVRRRQF